MDVGSVLLKIDAIVAEPSFVAMCKDFVNKHCDVFTDDLENRLEYTPIHEDYMSTVEGHIEQGLLKELGPDFDMSSFMEALPKYINNNKDEADGVGETIEFLTGFGEFNNFKDMMLVAKRDKVTAGDQSLQNAATGTSFSPEHEKIIQEARDFCAELVDTAEADYWTTVVDKPWIKVERRKKPGQHDFVRNTVTLDMDLQSAIEMVCNFTMERNNWDDFMTDIQTVQEMNGNDDKIVKITFRMGPMIPARTKYSRVLMTKDFPNKGEMSYMYLDWDNEKQQLCSARESIGNGVLTADPNDPKKTLYTSTHQLSNSWIPAFLVSWMMGTFMPRMMTKSALKYKKYKGLS